MAARLVDPNRTNVGAAVPNVLIISGFPWYTSEHAVHRYLTEIFPAAAPVTTRLYTNPTNGASRGHCFVEYHLPPAQSASAAVPSSPLNSSSLIQGVHAADRTENEGDDADAHLPPLLREVKQRVEQRPYECTYLKVRAYVLTAQRWSRAGRLPELPTDPPASHWRVRGGVLAGYGDEGFSVRCGSELGLPNTLTLEGYDKLERLRKRMRTTSAKRASGHMPAA
ncbi:hypothetical protein ABL78_0863 [Leptomonas seymouri]|uniref:RRM domain-containing protein n=1 Tax=Leptomonas seymouri TaxID=5684 RepID=A0A0N1I303_LEPSE|nr:hypothetical protein ABL78_0863 [Leptomonas seymouri]|eukprot:KPI90003.1 hypothetical protein ABL78_0863 [Leptomonas seymouri]